MKTIVDGRYEFEVIDEWPWGAFCVWNIGRHNFQHEGFIPLCKVDARSYVIPGTLRALAVGDEGLCLKVLEEAGYHRIYESDFNRIKKEYENNQHN